MSQALQLLQGNYFILTFTLASMLMDIHIDKHTCMYVYKWVWLVVRCGKVQHSSYLIHLMLQHGSEHAYKFTSIKTVKLNCTII